MSSFIKKIFRLGKIILRIDWIDTLRINLGHLPLSKGIKLPILLYHAQIDISDNAIIEINMSSKECMFGMIKLGCNYASNVISSIGVKIKLHKNSKLIFGGSAVVGNGSSIEVRQNGKIFIGKNFGNTGTLTICSDYDIHIGENVSCSWDVSIFDTDMHNYSDGQTGLSLPHMGAVHIGDFAWICQKCTLLKGTFLPKWSVLGACSLSSHDYSRIPMQDFTVFVGSPAKPTKKRIRRDDLYKISKASKWMISSGFRIINRIPSE